MPTHRHCVVRSKCKKKGKLSSTWAFGCPPVTPALERGGGISQVEASLLGAVSSGTARAAHKNKSKLHLKQPVQALFPFYRLEKEIDVLEFGESAPAAPKENSAAPSPIRPHSTSPAKEEQKSETMVNAQQVRDSRRHLVLSNTNRSSAQGNRGCST